MKKIRVLLDKGVIMTHLGIGHGQEEACRKIMFLCGDGSLEGCMTAQMFSDLFDELIGYTSVLSAYKIFDTLFGFIRVIPVGEKELAEATSKVPDILKDGISAAGAKNAKCSWIIAENKETSQYALFGTPVVEPEEFIQLYQKEVRKA